MWWPSAGIPRQESIPSAGLPPAYHRMSRSPQHSTAERLARIAEIRRQIAVGTYETPEKLEAAIDAWLDSVFPSDAGSGETPPPGRPR